MNESLKSHDPDHEHTEGAPSATVALLAGIFSLLFGFPAFSTNSILLLTLYKDPHNYFRTHATTFFVVSLALSDFIGELSYNPCTRRTCFASQLESRSTSSTRFP